MRPCLKKIKRAEGVAGDTILGPIPSTKVGEVEHIYKTRG